VAGAKSKWVRRRKIELAELVDEAWCLPMEGTLAALGIARAFRDKGLDPPRNVVNSNSLVLFQAMAVTGRILTVASRTRLRLSGKSSILKAVPVDLTIPWGSVSIVTLKHRTINPAAQLFIECAREVARLLATSK
jgi:DNA-binding transcriptional LysR family regulator